MRTIHEIEQAKEKYDIKIMSIQRVKERREFDVSAIIESTNPENHLMDNMEYDVVDSTPLNAYNDTYFVYNTHNILETSFDDTATKQDILTLLDTYIDKLELIDHNQA